MPIKIPTEIVYLLEIQKLFRSSETLARKAVAEKVDYFDFISVVKQKMGEKNYVLLKNDYPYDTFCKSNLEHFVLWFRKNISQEELQKAVDQIPNLHCYWENPTKFKSLPDSEINHYQVFTKKV